MSLKSAFATNANSELNGVQITVPDPEGGFLFRVRLARLGGRNTRLSSVRERVLAPYRHVPVGKMDQTVSVRLNTEVFVEACCLEWEVPAGKKALKYDPALVEVDGWVPGVERLDGTVVPFTVASLADSFLELPELLEGLMAEARNMELYRADLRSDDAKN